ncbi:MAG: SsgA family sporulation/cell division regulator [Actinomycetota bacterium]|nr:SsgA family sporulation/cell division regulator [Actinomycetota bacterium]
MISTTMVWRHLNTHPVVAYTVHLTWHETEPLIVTATLDADKPITWELSRDLLAAGLLHPCGAGDVRVYPWPQFGDVEIILATPQAIADFACDLGELDAFIAETFEVIAGGEETCDFDTELAELLTGEAA